FIMVSIPLEVLGVFSRWLHIVSVVALIGGAIYVWGVAAPALKGLQDDDRTGAWAAQAARFRPLVYAAIAGLLVSGTYNLLTQPGHTRMYHIWFGVKMLLAAHVFVSAALAVSAPAERPESESRGVRRLAGAAIVGLLAILVAAYLRRIY
ncbi:MAG TPA: hypothetical protein PLP04_16670, partial [Bryobacteraceae bacterium]|nr:hypothetical protein [Bryobacteraceae bacterium]